MFEKIETISKSFAIVSFNCDTNLIDDLFNTYVVFVDKNKKILGEVDEINKTNAKINFLGELSSTNFTPGIITKPLLNSEIRPINNEELQLLTGDFKEALNLGVSPNYENMPINTKINNLFSNHTAIFGNSGSGKTNGICRILQNVFKNKTNVAYNANIFIFDASGEYINAFKDINKINNEINYKLITTSQKNNNNYELLEIPFSLLTSEDILNLLDATKYEQVEIIETALELTKVLKLTDPSSNEYKNHILAKAITSIMYSNQNSTKIRDQIFDILSKTNTKELNLSATIEEVGFTRNFRNCFEIDSEGQFAERKIVTKYIESFIKSDDYIWPNIKKHKDYTIKDFEIALNFTLISERYLLNSEMYDSAISLKVKLKNLINSKYYNLFTEKPYKNIYEFLNKLVMKDNDKVQIININLEDIDDKLARTITKIYSRMFLNYVKSLKERASSPIHIVLEEAHRYVIENDDIELTGYNIFERIAKEGRKYGILLDLITQRPVELNPNVISQVDNFLVFKITHPLDLQYIEKTIPSINSNILEKQKTLQPGSCVAFGRILKLPMIIKLEKASPEPSSSNCDIYKTWIS